MPTVQWTLPIEVVSEANIHEHWTKKRKRGEIQNAYVKAAYLREKLNMQLPCKVVLTRISPRKLDDDNLVSAFKKIRDSVADLLIPGKAPGRADDSPLIQWEYRQQKGAPKEYGVLIDFIPICADLTHSNMSI